MGYTWYKTNREYVGSYDIKRKFVHSISQEYYNENILVGKRHVGNLNLDHSKIKSLNTLEIVDGNLNLSTSSITSLRNLKRVEGGVDLKYTNITSLGKLEYVKLYLDLRGTNLTSLGNLKYVCTRILCSEGTKTHQLIAKSQFKEQLSIV